jgi:hypothetical protein
MEKEEICDLLLKQFKGNKSLTWADIQEASFYTKIDSDYFVVENYVKFLIGENMLKEELINARFYVLLTEKGWFVMTNCNTDGYVAKQLQQKKHEHREQQTLRYAKWATIFAAGTILTWILDKILS